MGTTLAAIRDSAVECVRLDVAHGNLDIMDDDAVEEYCHESADGHHDVIYTYAVRELFANGDLDDYLEEAYDSGADGFADVDRVLQVAAYYAVRQAFADAVELVREDDDTTV